MAKASLLKKQKPKFRLSRLRVLILAPLRLVGPNPARIALVGVVMSIIGLYMNQSLPEGSYNLSSDQPISRKTAELVKQMISERGDTYKTARQIGKQFSFKQVAIRTTWDQDILVSLRHHAPAFTIVFDAPYLVSTDGLIFRKQDNIDPDLPILRSKDFDSHASFDPLGHIKQNFLVRRAVAGMLTLLHSGKPVKTANFLRDRGFLVSFEGVDPEVMVGYPPFEKKIARLDKILQEQNNLAKIELDFDDKAFIKKL